MKITTISLFLLLLLSCGESQNKKAEKTITVNTETGKKEDSTAIISEKEEKNQLFDITDWYTIDYTENDNFTDKVDIVPWIYSGLPHRTQAIKETPEGSIILTGYKSTADDKHALFIIIIDKDGNEQMNKTIDIADDKQIYGKKLITAIAPEKYMISYLEKPESPWGKITQKNLDETSLNEVIIDIRNNSVDEQFSFPCGRMFETLISNEIERLVTLDILKINKGFGFTGSVIYDDEVASKKRYDSDFPYIAFLSKDKSKAHGRIFGDFPNDFDGGNLNYIQQTDNGFMIKGFQEIRRADGIMVRPISVKLDNQLNITHNDYKDIDFQSSWGANTFKQAETGCIYVYDNNKISKINPQNNEITWTQFVLPDSITGIYHTVNKEATFSLSDGGICVCHSLRKDQKDKGSLLFTLLNTDGNIIWQKHLNHPAQNNFIQLIAQLRDGSILMEVATQKNTGSTYRYEYWIEKITAPESTETF